MVHILTFKEIYKERIWGGRNLEKVLGKKIPANVPIGESWELADLPEDKSVVSSGPMDG
jgi:mannose-6-phosphate isomerase